MNDNIQLFKANEVLQFKYISVPKELFVNPKYSHLSSDSKLLYGFILDRFHLSIQNNWKDENDNIYLIFARKDIQKLFHLSDKTVTKAFKELSNCNLIYEKKQGRNRPNLISKSNLNYYFKKNELSYTKEFDKLKKKYDLQGQIRSNSIIMCEIVFTSDKEFFDTIGMEETKRYFEESYKFICNYKNLGEKNIISAVVHFDESAPREYNQVA